VDFLPILPAIAAAFAGSARQRCTKRSSVRALDVTELSAIGGQEDHQMKIAVRLLLAVAVLSLAAEVSQAEPHQIVQGTQIKIKLLTDISTSISRN